MNQNFQEYSAMPAHFRLKTGLRFGLITSLISSLTGIALMSMGLIDFSQSSNGWISVLLTGLGIYLATEHYKKYSGGFMRGSDVVVTSIWLGFFSGLLGVIIMIIQLQLDPSILEKMNALMEMELEKQGIEGEAYDKALEIGKMMANPGFLAIGALIGSCLISLFLGFIMSFFLKKEAENPF